MRKDTIFKLGDRVYAPFHGYGVVTAIHKDACVYPIEVTWDDSGLKNMEDVSTFTADGLLSKYLANTDTILTVVKGSHKRNRRKEMAVSKYKVGDRVYNPSHGYGVVTEIKDDEQEYPIVVTWDEKQHGCSFSIFTPEGFAVKGLNSEDDDLTLVENGTPLKKGEKEMEECSKFKAGDRVFYPYHGLGTVIANHNDGRLYPIDVKWDKSHKGSEVSTFTKDGFLVVSLGECGDNDKLTVVESAMSKDAELDSTSLEGINLSKEDDTGVVERMMDALNKKTEDAINPSHYKVKGLSEAHEIMNHLMHREQLEGFYWGNIIKYAYRYGRKGDKAETAGKIAWYAAKLKELGECESE